LFSAPVDLAAFLGSAIVALCLLAVGAQFGLLEGGAPDWSWITAVLLVDVAHVYATAFRVYFNPAEMRRRMWLYLLTPLLAFALGAALYSEGSENFWRVLAYLAVFHFVRQQYGWVAMYRAKAGEDRSGIRKNSDGEQPGSGIRKNSDGSASTTSEFLRIQLRFGKWIDTAAIYLATLYPLIYWHAHLPRKFWWFLKGDFAGVPVIAEQVVAPFYWLALAAYAARSLYCGLKLGRWNPGKDIVLATTAVCWHVGIITFNSDYAFMVTNVIIHGVPYIVLIYWFHVRPVADAASVGSEAGSFRPVAGTARRVFLFLATLWLLAFVEELLWHRGHWHKREWLFGSSWDVEHLEAILIPLLAVPQITHYVLDGFIWRRRSNPDLR
jgi:hypothetical protein